MMNYLASKNTHFGNKATQKKIVWDFTLNMIVIIIQNLKIKQNNLKIRSIRPSPDRAAEFAKS